MDVDFVYVPSNSECKMQMRPPATMLQPQHQLPSSRISRDSTTPAETAVLHQRQQSQAISTSVYEQINIDEGCHPPQLLNKARSNWQVLGSGAPSLILYCAYSSGNTILWVREPGISQMARWTRKRSQTAAWNRKFADKIRPQAQTRGRRLERRNHAVRWNKRYS